MKIKYLMLLIFTILCLQTVSALRNPAADYCLAMGYDYTTQMTPDGEEGLCKLPNGQTVEEWNFLLGEAAQEFSYCAQQGYEQKITKDPEKCAWFLTDTCAVCIVDGREVEVTDLMGLDFRETTCGDGSCGFPETIETCPQDCADRPLVSPPAYEMMPVKPKTGIPNIVWIIAGAIVGVIFFLWFTRKKKPKRSHRAK